MRRSCRTSVPIAASTTTASISDAACVSRRALAGCPWRDGELFSRTCLRSVRENDFHRKFHRLAMCCCSRGALRLSSRTRWCGAETRGQCLRRIVFQHANARASSWSSRACKTGAVMRALADTRAIARGRGRGRRRRCVVSSGSQLRQGHLRNAPNEMRDTMNFPASTAEGGERCPGTAWSRLAQTQADRLATIGSP